VAGFSRRLDSLRHDYSLRHGYSLRHECCLKARLSLMILHGPEAWFFWVLALSALIGGLFTVLSRSAVHSAMCLMLTLISTAGLFLLMHAEFVMGVQILVYVGGVLVLFLFVIMLVNVREERLDKARLFSGQWLLAIILAGLLALTFSYAFRLADPYNNLRATAAGGVEAQPVVNFGGATPVSNNAQEVGWALYTSAALPFEIASVLLLVAILGSVLLARTPRQERLAEGEEQAS
jgi:NADH-quinone oxidoreductase subunit J